MAGQPVQIHTSRKLVAAGSPACLGKAGSWCYRSPPTWRDLSTPAHSRWLAGWALGLRRRIVSGDGWEDIKKRCKDEDEVERLCVLYIYIYRGTHTHDTSGPARFIPRARTLDNNRSPEMSRRTKSTHRPSGWDADKSTAGLAVNLFRKGVANRGVTHRDERASDNRQKPDDDERHPFTR